MLVKKFRHIRGSKRILGTAALFAVLPAFAPEQGPAPVLHVDEAELAAGIEGTLDADLLVAEPAIVDEQPQERIATGKASFYGKRFAGRPTANGERFNPADLTAAHRSLPFGSLVKVTNVDTGKSVTVRINDRGPYHGDRVIDLSRSAAEQIDMVRTGTAAVSLDLVTA